ncbi:MAG TPA: hypothetical protein VJX91_07685, partial [Candidatus Eisenbacteria bacterium]|nr:hypothetical protein [Candidatus Eisenbacteria bacterium]
PPKKAEPQGQDAGKRDARASEPQRFTQRLSQPSAYATPGPWMPRRELHPHEQKVKFGEIVNYLDQEPLRVWHRVVDPIRQEQMVRIAEHAATASDADLAQGQLVRPFTKKMSSELTTALLGAYMEGRKAVRAEVSGAKRPAIARLAAGNSQDLLEPTPAERTWIRRLAEKFVSLSTMGLITAAIREAITSRQADLPDDETQRRVQRALQDVSIPTAQAELAGTITTAYTTGRNDQGKAMRDEIGVEYYSAVMDDGTCEPCAALDGMEQEPGGDSFETPNPECDWPDRCRCITVFEAKGAEVAA